MPKRCMVRAVQKTTRDDNVRVKQTFGYVRQFSLLLNWISLALRRA